MTEKMTKKKWFAVIREIVEASNYSEKEGALAMIDNEIYLLNKKSDKATLTKTQTENLAITETIREVLADAENPMTVTEMMKDSRLEEYSNQKLSALLKKLVDAKEVVKTTEKKKSYFSLKRE